MGKNKEKRRKNHAATQVPANEPAPALLETHLGYWIRHVSNHVSTEFARALQARQVSVAEWVALSRIHDRPNITPSELADTLGMTRGAISKVLDKLEAKKWITSQTTPGDQRVQQLSHTADGSAALPALAEIADRNEEFFSCLTGKEQTQLRAILLKLAAAHELVTPKFQPPSR